MFFQQPNLPERWR